MIVTIFILHLYRKQEREEEALLRMRSKSCPPIRLHHQHVSSNSRPSSSSSSKYEELLQGNLFSFEFFKF